MLEETWYTPGIMKRFYSHAKIYTPTLIVGLVLGIGVYFLFGNSATSGVEQHSEGIEGTYIVSYSLDRTFFDEAYEKPHDFGEREEARVLVLPHHLVARPFIAGALNAQSKVKNPKTIVVVGPDHLNRASGSIITTNLQWRTPYGFMHPDTEYIDALVEKDLVTVESSVFEEEHSIGALVPFLHKTFPDSRIVPLIVRSDLDSDLSYEIADLLAQDMVMLIASVDFSHYLPQEVAYFHDSQSINALELRDYSRLEELEIDSPKSLEFAFNFAEQTATEHFDLYINENSNSFFGYPVSETTSYVVGGYTAGPRIEKSPITILSVGDMMFDRYVKTKIEQNSPNFPFENIMALENRFFRGVDVILGNLEGTISEYHDPVKTFDFAFDNTIADVLAERNFSAVSLANNHSYDQGVEGYDSTVKTLEDVGIGSFGHQYDEEAMVWTKTVNGRELTVVGFNAVWPNFDEAEALAFLEEVSKETDVTVVHIHWGEEYEVLANDSQRTLGKKLVDHGANAVIGHHPHVIQGMEVYKRAPIFWSLGNFIFDQNISIETETGLAVGLEMHENETIARVFPVHIENTQPRLAIGEDREMILKSFAERSSLSDEYLAMAHKGVIEISK